MGRIMNNGKEVDVYKDYIASRVEGIICDSMPGFIGRLVEFFIEEADEAYQSGVVQGKANREVIYFEQGKNRSA